MLFCVAFKHNLWLSTFEDFVKGQYFMKSDVLSLIKLLKLLIVSYLNLVLEGKKLTSVEESAFQSSTQLLRLLHEYFGINSYIETEHWDLQDIVDWKEEMRKS